MEKRIQVVVASGGGVEIGSERRGQRQLSGVTKIFCILAGISGTQVDAFIKQYTSDLRVSRNIEL